MKDYRVCLYFLDNKKLLVPDDTPVFEFDDLQEALAKFDYEMKNFDNRSPTFGIRVQKKTSIGYLNLIDFLIEVAEIDVLLKSS